MLTANHVEALKLGIAPIDDRTILLVESALNWVLNNTTLKFDYTDYDELAKLPANVRLFAVRYIDVMSMQAGVTSESISGLSQSFNTSEKSSIIWQYAEELLGDLLCSRVRFVSAVKRWG